MPKPKVLFLCSANSARSQMAEALLRKHGDDRFDVYSCGIEAKGVNPYTIRVLEELGIDTSRHYSKDIREYMGKMNFAYLITVCSAADRNCPSTFPGISKRMHWPFDDPAAYEGSDAEKLETFRTVRNQIEQKILAWLQELDGATSPAPADRTSA
ncbi:MAG: arsenate reductase ArsC [Caldilineaceae bacterium]|nr:arsenate reductase ArsC [Caldilineaceae bacterium]